jgi:hypothetical protein
MILGGYGEMSCTYMCRTVVVKMKRPLGRPSGRWQDISIDAEGIQCESAARDVLVEDA